MFKYVLSLDRRKSLCNTVLSTEEMWCFKFRVESNIMPIGT